MRDSRVTAMVSLPFLGCASPPTSVGFMARAALFWVDAALAKNLPHRSREHEFTAGRLEMPLAVRVCTPDYGEGISATKF